jgi:hypothetical protein
LPQGDPIAAYPTYLEAQQAVDYLSDQKFPVQGVTIVGTDLRMVERVTGRLSYGRVAVAGAGSGAWFGLFVGLLLSMVGTAGSGGVFIGVTLGAGFGLLFSVLSYALARGRRDFTSQSQIVATTYAILCDPASAGEARSLLMRSPGGLGRARPGSAPVTPSAPAAPYPPQPGATAPGQFGGPAAPTPPPAPRTPDPRWTTPSGEPRYGAMLPTPDAPATPTQPGQPVPLQSGQPTPPQQPGQPVPPQPGQPTPPATGSEDSTRPADPYAPPRHDG